MARMAKAEPVADRTAGGDDSDGAQKTHGRRKVILLAVPLILGGAGAGLWFSGILPRLLGRHSKTGKIASVPVKPVFVDLPEMVANLAGDPRRPSYVKLDAQLEVRNSADAAQVKAAMPRLQDLFQTYLRDMHPDELRGSEGTYRLREELLARANIAAAPAKVMDILFIQLLVQ